MGRADDFLERAAAADELAAKCIAGSDQQRQFKEIADQWRDRARQARTLDHSDDPRKGIEDSL